MSSPEFRLFKKILKDNGYFVTGPRMSLFATLQNNPALPIKELIGKIDSHDQSSVYRNVNLFEELGIVNRLRLGWNTRLELSDKFIHHHHHITCVSCGEVWALDEDEVIEKRLSSLATAQGFKTLEHNLEIRGECQKCRAS
jgi:Fur family ferric uptake transcriptional regulator